MTWYKSYCFIFLAFYFSFPVFNHSYSLAKESPSAVEKQPVHRHLYVAVPGIRNYLGYGGHGLLVFDIDKGHEFVKRIPLQGLKQDGTPSNIKGIAVSIQTMH